MSKTPKTPRAHLVAALRRQLVPELNGLGFDQTARLPHETAKLASHYHPLGYFRRPMGERTLCLDIQFDKLGRPFFRVTMGTLPPGPLRGADGTLYSHDHGASWCADDMRTIRPSLGPWAWFGPWPWQGAQQHADRIATSATMKVRSALAALERRSGRTF